MKNITAKVTLFIAVAALCITVYSCKKTTTDSDLSTIQDEALAETEANNVGSFADAGASISTGSSPRSAQGGATWQIFKCATISFNKDSSAGIKVMTITFNNGCICSDGKIRTGQINVTWNGGYRDSNTVIHTYTSNYTVNGNQQSYEKWVKNAGHVNGYITFNINDTASITTSTGTISWVSTRQRQWIAGSDHPWEWWLTKYSITGTASGIDRKGVAYTVAITNPIIADFSCYWILTKGTYDVMPQGKPERIIDFGNGSCDNNATCTINGVTYAFQFGTY